MRSLAAVAILVGLFATACSNGTAPGTNPRSGKLRVVAAENFWGSIASQLGGDRVDVTSIITNPNTDPHDYEPTPADGREIASAQYVIANGVGYDTWMTKLLSANPSTGRTTLTVGALVGAKPGDNPHRWYFPSDVEAVTKRITADLKHIDIKDAAYFDQRYKSFESNDLATYHGLLADIKRRFSGTPVGASESIFVGMAQATGLDLITPSRYMTAISEGTDPASQDKATVDAQIKDKRIKVFVFNSQNATPDVRALVDAAKANGIETTTVTETLAPANATFEAWQSKELTELRDALAKATGR
jgi:zinc/manganese transport system substrate-binding protein